MNLDYQFRLWLRAARIYFKLSRRVQEFCIDIGQANERFPNRIFINCSKSKKQCFLRFLNYVFIFDRRFGCIKGYVLWFDKLKILVLYFLSAQLVHCIENKPFLLTKCWVENIRMLTCMPAPECILKWALDWANTHMHKWIDLFIIFPFICCVFCFHDSYLIGVGISKFNILIDMIYFYCCIVHTIIQAI